jgi:hypothetical protein
MKFFRSIILTCAFLFSPSVILAAETGTGTVAETLNSGGYVYMKLEEGQWIAANTFAVNKGDKVKYSGAMEMNDFHSKSLDRTFESILFVSEAGLVSDDSAVKTPAKLPGNADKVAKPTAAPAAGEIKPLAEGKTIADIFVESDQLKEQMVSLNAKVIKINKHIMGRNWITLQDGTGTEPQNKLLATSQEEVSPGDIMIVKGTVKTDVDLGYGYHYEVMLEEATFSPGLE